MKQEELWEHLVSCTTCIAWWVIYHLIYVYSHFSAKIGLENYSTVHVIRLLFRNSGDV